MAGVDVGAEAGARAGAGADEAKPVKRRKGRGARERILAAAFELFYAQGINATGLNQLAAQAGVSKRTLYTHFPSKEDLVSAYLESVEQFALAADAKRLAASGTPREKMLHVFDGLSAFSAPESGVLRGCPFLNAAVEAPAPDDPAHEIVRREKTAFAERMSALARQAGARAPEQLGEQLALIYDGAAARGLALNDPRTAETARKIAEALVDAALTPSA